MLLRCVLLISLWIYAVSCSGFSTECSDGVKMKYFKKADAQLGTNNFMFSISNPSTKNDQEWRIQYSQGSTLVNVVSQTVTYRDKHETGIHFTTLGPLTPDEFEITSKLSDAIWCKVREIDNSEKHQHKFKGKDRHARQTTTITQEKALPVNPHLADPLYTLKLGILMLVAIFVASYFC